VARALGVDLVLHPEAEALIRERFGAETTPVRLRMGEFPRGAAIIPNSVNRIPGFSVREHHFVPGFPSMAWSMVEWLLDGRYRHLHHREAEADASIIVYGSAESTLTPLMQEVERRFRRLKVYSLPHMGEDGSRRHIELGVRGDPQEVAQAIEVLKQGVVATGATFEPAPSTQQKTPGG
jgi:molybdopterin-biosynthesis enzyme MoeA-like protein